MKPIKPDEKKNKFLNVGLTPSVNEKIQAFADEHGVNRSVAARYILENFLNGNFEITEDAPISKNFSDFENIGMQS